MPLYNPTGTVAAGSISDGELASPNNATYRTIFDRGGRFDAAVTGIYPLINAEGALANTGTATAYFATKNVYLDPADYAVTGLTTKYRVRAALLSNATTSGTVTFTVGLYPVTTPIGGAASVTVTIGTVVAGSTIAFVSPGANATATNTSGDFSAPAAGNYALGMAISVNNMAASSSIWFGAHLQHRST